MDAHIQFGDAITQMKMLTENYQTFSFSFMSYNESKGSSSGEVLVPKASIRSKASTNSIMLEYIDHTQQMNKHCYECLLMTFNGKKIII